MNIAFALYKYFPYGGLQRDMLRIAQACVLRGAAVTIFCSEWEGVQPDHLRVETLQASGSSNHKSNYQFYVALTERLKKEQYDVLVGFNKMPGLDVYYAADTCFKAKLVQERFALLRFLPRYRQFLHDEAAVFACESTTKVLAIAARSVDEYEKYYPGSQRRCTILPPGINPDRRAGENAATIRSKFRSEWSLTDKDKLVVMIGSGFRTKGLDRAIDAIASLEPALLMHTKLIVIGQDKPDAFIRQARNIGVEKNIQFLSGRDDIPDFLQGADILVHPAYRENTGTVLLEAAVAGLPVLTTAVCGYSSYIRDYACGMVIDEPYEQKKLDSALASMLRDDGQRAVWRSNALKMAATADIYSLVERAADLIVFEARSRTA